MYLPVTLVKVSFIISSVLYIICLSFPSKVHDFLNLFFGDEAIEEQESTDKRGHILPWIGGNRDY